MSSTAIWRADLHATLLGATKKLNHSEAGEPEDCCLLLVVGRYCHSRSVLALFQASMGCSRSHQRPWGGGSEVGALETTCVGVSRGCIPLVYFEYLGIKCRMPGELLEHPPTLGTGVHHGKLWVQVSHIQRGVLGEKA